MGIPITGRITTVGQPDIFATQDANRGALGFHSVNSLAERNAIPIDRRKGTYEADGANVTPKPFFVCVRDGAEVKLYWLKNEPGTDATTDTDWEEFVATVEEPFQGFFNPNFDSFFVDGVGVKGHYWIANDVGSYQAGVGADVISYAQYDKALYDGAEWQKAGGGTVVADWNTMTNKPASFPPAGHTHEQSEVNDLVTDLANKVDWNTQVEHTLSGSPSFVPASDAVSNYAYSKTNIDNKFANLSTYGIKYAWNTLAEQNSTSGMLLGDLGLRNDEQKVYKWSGVAWDYFFTVSGGGGTLTEEVISDLNVGGIVVSEVFSIGTTLTDFVKALLKTTTPPVYTAPELSITINPADLLVEVGSTVDIDIIPTYSQNDAGATAEYNVYKNSVEFVSSAGVGTNGDTPYDIVADTTYSASVTYAQGPIENDSDGNPYPVGRIPASTIYSEDITISPKRMLFYDTSVDAGTSSNIRNYIGQVINPQVDTVFSIDIPAGATNVRFAYPASLGVVHVVLDTILNYNIKASFVLSVVNVEGANSYTAIPYNVYSFIPVEEYQDPITYTVTI